MAPRLNVRPTAALKAHPLWSQTDFEYFRARAILTSRSLNSGIATCASAANR